MRWKQQDCPPQVDSDKVGGIPARLTGVLSNVIRKTVYMIFIIHHQWGQIRAGFLFNGKGTDLKSPIDGTPLRLGLRSCQLGNQSFIEAVNNL
jgi:hypothetical protein